MRTRLLTTRSHLTQADLVYLTEVDGRDYVAPVAVLAEQPSVIATPVSSPDTPGSLGSVEKRRRSVAHAERGRAQARKIRPTVTCSPSPIQPQVTRPAASVGRRCGR